jgi:LysM repeat protein
MAMLAWMTAADAGAPLAEPSPRSSGCPFLLSEDGGWRLEAPSRDHRCAAFSPAAPLAPEKQARLCLTDAHVSCATYLASIAAREARLGAPPAERATRWGLARTTTVIEDPGGVRSRLLTAALDRRRWPAIPAILLVGTLFVLAVTGLRGVLPITGVAASPSLSAPPVALATATVAPVTTQAPVLTLPPTGSVEPTTSAPAPTPIAPAQTAGPTPKPTYRTYRVRSGDTLSGIAAKFHTTVTAISQLNHISDPSKLRIGQILLIPN